MKISFTAFIYEDHLTPHGLLPRERKGEASAAWHFARLAHQALVQVPEQASYEGDTDQTVNLRTIAESVQQMYGLKRLEDMMVFMDFVKAEAIRSGIPWSGRFDAWLASGGKSYDEVTREPEALNKS